LTVKKIKREIKTIKKSGIEISASYIIGALGETRKNNETNSRVRH
jgi:DNA-binding winged helix-turn-helix (wHTH) protein